MKKVIVSMFFLVFMFFGYSFANNISGSEYIFFYANGCSHCQKVEKFFEKNNATKIFQIKTLEIRNNKNNLSEFKFFLDKLNIDLDQASVPFLVINNPNECSYINGDKGIIDFFQKKLDNKNLLSCNGEELVCKGLQCEEDTLVSQKKYDGIKKILHFLAIMIPASLSDSINPCAFAVILLLLTGILSKTKNRKKAFLTGLSFALSIFISYFLMGIGIFSALASSENTKILKIIVGIFGTLIGLANLKDFFWYGKGFVMEVPFSRRPKLQKIISKITSPVGAFVIGLLVSLFLLPCTSGPYFTILGYLASNEQNLNLQGYIYLLIYNLIFVLPMVIISVLVSFGKAGVEGIIKAKNKYKKLTHLVVGIIMIILGLYILLPQFF